MITALQYFREIFLCLGLGEIYSPTMVDEIVNLQEQTITSDHGLDLGSDQVDEQT